MHQTPVKDNNRPVNKVINMKSVPVKGKKALEPERDYVSETISFVIKGKLTPIVAKKVAAHTPAIGRRALCRNTDPGSKLDPKSKPAMKKAKPKKGEASSKPDNTAQAKIVKKPASPSRILKKSATETTNTIPVEDNIKKDVRPAASSSGPSHKTDVPTKKVPKESKLLKKVKTAATDVKPRPKKVTVKRAKSPQKADAAIDKDKQKVPPKLRDQSEQNKKAEDMRTKQTIAKLLKQANRALNHPCSETVGVKKTKTSKSSGDCRKSLNKESPAVAGKPKVQRKAPSKSKAKAETKVTEPVASPEIEPIEDNKTNPEDNVCDTSTSDDMTLNELCIKKEANESAGKKTTATVKTKKLRVKKDIGAVTGKKSPMSQSLKRQQQKKLINKTNLMLLKKRALTKKKLKAKQKDDQRNRKMKLFSLWNGPKRHRVASLNALAKVHCLYENETRGNILDVIDKPSKRESSPSTEKSSASEVEVPTCTRTLRSVPGLRAVGKHWDMTDPTSSSEDNNSGYESTPEVDIKPKIKIKKEPVKKSEETSKSEPKRRRNRPELVMDLKDMVVRKRMASLNASAILAASYSMEKRVNKSPRNDSDSTLDSSDYFATDTEEDTKKVLESEIKKEEDNKVIEVRATPNNMAVILNKDTDVTITGVYVNSTTRSTHHEGYCSIAGMQYRISATSHTQTAATAVATETVLQSSSSSTQENSNSESLTSCKSYTPLDALSNMQPPAGPGVQHPHPHMGPPQHILPMSQLSPDRRPHGCTSAFTAPHGAPPYHPAPPPPPGHHHAPPPPGEPGYVHENDDEAQELVSGSITPPANTKQLDAAVRSLLGKPSDSGCAFADPLHQDIIIIWESLARQGLDVPTRTDLLKKYFTPSNGLFMQPPKINPEVKASVKVSATDSVLRRDERLAAIQNQIGTSLAVIGKALTFCLEQKREGDNHELIEWLGDAGRLLADVHHSESVSRRNLLSFGLNKKFKETMEESSIDEWLFGENFGQRLTAAKSLEKSAADLKNTLRKAKKPESERPLNSYRPPRPRYRPPNRDGQKFRSQNPGAKPRPQQQRSPYWKSQAPSYTRRR